MHDGGDQPRPQTKRSQLRTIVAGLQRFASSTFAPLDLELRSHGFSLETKADLSLVSQPRVLGLDPATGLGLRTQPWISAVGQPLSNIWHASLSKAGDNHCSQADLALKCLTTLGLELKGRRQ